MNTWILNLSCSSYLSVKWLDIVRFFPSFWGKIVHNIIAMKGKRTSTHISKTNKNIQRYTHIHIRNWKYINTNPLIRRERKYVFDDKNHHFSTDGCLHSLSLRLTLSFGHKPYRWTKKKSRKMAEHVLRAVH